MRFTPLLLVLVFFFVGIVSVDGHRRSHHVKVAVDVDIAAPHHHSAPMPPMPFPEPVPEPLPAVDPVVAPVVNGMSVPTAKPLAKPIVKTTTTATKPVAKFTTRRHRDRVGADNEIFSQALDAIGVDISQAPTAKVEFTRWSKSYNKRYAAADLNPRISSWVANWNKVQTHNADPTQSYTMKLYEWADLSHEEFVAMKTGAKGNAPVSASVGGFALRPMDETSVPASFDWRDNNGFQVVSEVRDQGQCGSCWAHSAVEALESAYALGHQRDVEMLSVQHMMDCSSNVDVPGAADFGFDGVHAEGCNGGFIEIPLLWAKVHSVALDKTVKYKAKDNACEETATPSGVLATGVADVAKDVDSIKQALVQGVLGITIHVSDSFQSYSQGVYTGDDCGEEHINHAVGLVGYGTDSDSGKNYWIVKNSWGERWGENGYIRMLSGSNICQVESGAVSVTAN